jgi:Family of unknown function (DUF5763)
LDAQCRATKANGQSCKGAATASNGYCWAHDPNNSAKRQRTASKAGRGKPSREIKDLKDQLRVLAEDVLEGRVDRGDAVVVNQILNTRARLIELERKIREHDVLEERLEALEQAQAQNGGGGRWRGV